MTELPVLLPDGVGEADGPDELDPWPARCERVGAAVLVVGVLTFAAAVASGWRTGSHIVPDASGSSTHPG
ncbi:MAG: hypothetical protein ACYDH6_18590 [Acidimicrobiales bacterium]